MIPEDTLAHDILNIEAAYFWNAMGGVEACETPLFVNAVNSLAGKHKLPHNEIVDIVEIAKAKPYRQTMRRKWEIGGYKNRAPSGE